MAKTTGNGRSIALTVATGVAIVVLAALILGAWPTVSAIQTTVEAKMEHAEIEERTAKALGAAEKRVGAAASAEYGRFDVVLSGHRQLIDQQRGELKEYRQELRVDRAASRDQQRELLDAIKRRR